MNQRNHHFLSTLNFRKHFLEWLCPFIILTFTVRLTGTALTLYRSGGSFSVPQLLLFAILSIAVFGTPALLQRYWLANFVANGIVPPVQAIKAENIHTGEVQRIRMFYEATTLRPFRPLPSAVALCIALAPRVLFTTSYGWLVLAVSSALTSWGFFLTLATVLHIIYTFWRIRKTSAGQQIKQLDPFCSLKPELYAEAERTHQVHHLSVQDPIPEPPPERPRFVPGSSTITTFTSGFGVPDTARVDAPPEHPDY